MNIWPVIVRKDLARIKMLVAIWIVTLVISAIFRLDAQAVSLSVGSYVAAKHLSGAILIGWLRFAIVYLGLIPILMQQDSMADINAGWRTRPIRGMQLMYAKVGTLLLIVILPQLLVDLVVLSCLGIDSGSVAAIGTQLLFENSATVFAYASIAALTTSIYRYMFALALTHGLIAVGSMVVNILSFGMLNPYRLYVPAVLLERIAQKESAALLGVLFAILIGIGAVLMTFRRIQQQTTVLVVVIVLVVVNRLVVNILPISLLHSTPHQQVALPDPSDFSLTASSLSASSRSFDFSFLGGDMSTHHGGALYLQVDTNTPFGVGGIGIHNGVINGSDGDTNKITFGASTPSPLQSPCIVPNAVSKLLSDGVDSPIAVGGTPQCKSYSDFALKSNADVEALRAGREYTLTGRAVMNVFQLTEEYRVPLHDGAEAATSQLSVQMKRGYDKGRQSIIVDERYLTVPLLGRLALRPVQGRFDRSLFDSLNYNINSKLFRFVVNRKQLSAYPLYERRFNERTNAMPSLNRFVNESRLQLYLDKEDRAKVSPEWFNDAVLVVLRASYVGEVEKDFSLKIQEEEKN